MLKMWCGVRHSIIVQFSNSKCFSINQIFFWTKLDKKSIISSSSFFEKNLYHPSNIEYNAIARTNYDTRSPDIDVNNGISETNDSKTQSKIWNERIPFCFPEKFCSMNIKDSNFQVCLDDYFFPCISGRFLHVFRFKIFLVCVCRSLGASFRVGNCWSICLPTVMIFCHIVRL